MDRVAIQIGPVSIMWYALFIVSGIILGLGIVTWLGKSKGYDFEDWIDFLLLGLPIGLVGTRLYFILFNLPYYQDNPAEMFNVRSGGLAIHGAIITGLIYTYFFNKKKDFNFLTTVDILAPAFILAQSIGRWGNFINQEAYGQVVSQEALSWLPQFIQEGMYIDGAYHQPTFLYESIWNLVVFVVMIVFFKSKYYKPGRVLGIYLIGYSFGRFFIEDLRMDSLYLGNIQVARLISIAMIAAGAYLFYWTMESGKGKN